MNSFPANSEASSNALQGQLKRALLTASAAFWRRDGLNVFSDEEDLCRAVNENFRSETADVRLTKLRVAPSLAVR